MILEIVNWDIKEGLATEFEEAFGKVQHLLSNSEGYISHQLQKCIERPNGYILLVRWQSLEHHTKQFKKSEAYGNYKATLQPFYKPGATVEHFETVFDNA